MDREDATDAANDTGQNGDEAGKGTGVDAGLVTGAPEEPAMGPRLPRFYISRRRLWDRLDLAADCAMTLVVAPVGSGKTLGVAGWLREAVAGRERRSSSAWVHGDPVWEADRLAVVLDRAAAASERDDGRPPPHLVIVDDAHLLPAATHRMLSRRLNEDPESMRVLLLSRWDLPIAHLVPELMGTFAVIRGDCLRLDDDEARSLIIADGRTSSAEVVDAITAYAGGWCAAVVLASRAVAASPDPAAAAQRCAEATGRFADQVAGDLFASLSPRVRHLLLCLSAEDVVTPHLAAHLSRDRFAGDLLAELDGTGLLVVRSSECVALDDGAEGPVDSEEADGLMASYRLHPLLKEVIRRRLVAGGVDVMGARATVVRAVEMDAASGETTHALERLVAVRAFDTAASFLAEHGVTLAMRGEGRTLARFARDHAEHVAATPTLWFPLALERWIAGDVAAAQQWLDQRLTANPPLADDELACTRLMRARLGLEPLWPAVGFAGKAVLTATAAQGPGVIVPQLLTELAITENWLGDLHKAEVHLVSAIGLAQTRDLVALHAAALSHLAFTHYMLGHESACAEVAAQGLAHLDESRSWAPQFTRTRLGLASSLARAVDVPWVEARSVEESGLMHPTDWCTRFWMRIQNAHAALREGSVAQARRVLEDPLGVPESSDLPDHLRVVQLAEQAAMAGLAGDRAVLKRIETELASASFVGEAAWVAGLRADLEGDRRLAAAHFETAADDATFAQPVIRPIALVSRAQLLDELGSKDEANQLLRQAAVETEVRRNAAPFLGWTRQGTPIHSLLESIAISMPRAWVIELNSAMAATGSIAGYFDPVMATPNETVEEPTAHVPVLSAREREVLRQLARGATYADISNNLFVSENTVKTHISNLYAKLGAARRSEALALARAHHLI